ncbi:MAG: glycosyltransferase family 4 protein [Bryobacterales bacterium]|jgi:glycosyltransferase involved in cell wall biosynthesis|nr:glycosyltransferase family 4 protein [Bryobacterales bacterium]
MRFAVDAHAIGRHLTGNEVYVRSLLNGFASIDEEMEILAYLSSADARQWVPKRFSTRVVSPNPFVRLGWDLSRRLAEDRPDLLHVQYTAPLNCPVPVIVSVHDVSFLDHPQFFPASRSFQLRWSVERTVRQAAHVLTGSDFSREAILRAYRLAPERVSVIPNAANPFFRPLHIDNACDWVRNRFQLPTPFVLSVGDLQPRKNPVALIQAFAQLVKAQPELRHRLALVGQDTWYSAKVREAIRESGVSDRIRLLGFVTDEDLLHLYNACEVFVFPSLYEGFGLPVLEAMACGRAVACSNTTAVPEVADGAAILFDPRSVDEIARAMADLLRDPELRIRMERLGQQRAAAFSWNRTAERTLAAYYRAAQAVRVQTGKSSSIKSR